MMDVHLAEPGRRLWRVLLAVPHAVADTDHSVFDVLQLESEGFLDQTCETYVSSVSGRGRHRR
jgi:hypothetical protein